MLKLKVPLVFYPVLPLRDIVVFPDMVAPLFVGRKKSISAIQGALQENSKVVLLTQKDATKDAPSEADLYTTGTLANVLQLLTLPDGTAKALIEGYKRVKVHSILNGNEFFSAEAEILHEEDEDQKEVHAIMRVVVEQFEQYSALNDKISNDLITAIKSVQSPAKLASSLSVHLAMSIPEKQQLLEINSVYKRLEQILQYMEGEIEVLNTEQKIRSRVRKQMDKTQKEYYLNEQLRAINKELGEEDGKSELTVLEDRINKTKFSKEAKDKALSELKRLKNMPAIAAEAGILRNYLDWMLDIPWNKNKLIKKDINFAADILDRDHYGLTKVKERIIEYLAVQQRTKKLKGPVLCLVGPPGVGKTSLAKSIADAVGRNFIKISLGGVRDEAEIRGHRRTYVGAMPGKIIQSMKKAKNSNPLILLDELDKIGSDFRGDPAAALLEVLDPEQNSCFNDHYLEVDYDLSQVMFIATANSLNLPPALLDRLEVIRLSGYTEEEKIEIAKTHLLSKQAKNHGLKKSEWNVPIDVLQDIIRYYTREAGVRNIEREIAKIARKIVKKIITENIKTIKVTTKNLGDFLGVRKFSFGETEKDNLIGVVTGLAYTEVGGDLLSVEAVQLPGKGEIKCTGKLGDVMQESAQAAFSYARSRSGDYGITPLQYQKSDIHIHVPEGATPKDGPSAGIALCTAVVSAMTGIPVVKTVAMTGEITLRGRVLAIGGLKEKLLAALRGNVKTVLIPKENAKDLEEVPENVKDGLKFVLVSHMDEVLPVALTTMPEPVSWKEEENDEKEIVIPIVKGKGDSKEVITH